MTFYEINYPLVPNEGTLSGPGANTNVVAMDSGQENAVQRWSQIRRHMDVAHHIQSHDDVRELIEFYHRVGGPANGFRVKDWSDYATNDKGRLWGDDSPSAVAYTDVVIGIGNGINTQFQLKKIYGSTAPQYNRKITKPVAGTVLSGLAAVQKIEGTHWTVDTTTGIITYTTPPGDGVEVTAGCEFDVPMRFGVTLDEMLPATMDDHGSSSVRSVPMVELLDPSAADEHHNFGGSYDAEFGADISISMLTGRFIALRATTTGRKVNLPAKATVPDGGEIFCITNKGTGGDDSFYVYDSDTTTSLLELAVGEAAFVYLGRHPTTQAATWYAFQV